MKKAKKKKSSVPAETEPIPENPQHTEEGKKIFKLDPDAKNGKRELLVINIALKNKHIEATIREDTNLNLLSEKISVVADFKSCPKKFKDIFTNYLRNEFKSAMQQMKL